MYEATPFLSQFQSHPRILYLSIWLSGSKSDSSSLDWLIPIIVALVDLAMIQDSSVFGCKLWMLRWIKCKSLVLKILHFHDSCAIAAFRKRSIESVKDKGMEVTYVIEWCDTLKRNWHQLFFIWVNML